MTGPKTPAQKANAGRTRKIFNVLFSPLKQKLAHKRSEITIGIAPCWFSGFMKL